MQQVETALHDEMSRQLKLVQLEQQHLSASEKLLQWANAQLQTITSWSKVSTSGDARTRLKFLESLSKVQPGILMPVDICIDI
jgi:hypothetical protein